MGFQYIKYLQLKCHIPQLIMTIFPGTRFPAYPFSFAFQNDSCSISTKNHINNPNRINLPSPRPQWSLFSLSLIHIFATGSAMRADLFYWDGLYDRKNLFDRISLIRIYYTSFGTEVEFLQMITPSVQLWHHK